MCHIVTQALFLAAQQSNLGPVNLPKTGRPPFTTSGTISDCVGDFPQVEQIHLLCLRSTLGMERGLRKLTNQFEELLPFLVFYYVVYERGRKKTLKVKVRVEYKLLSRKLVLCSSC